MMLTLLATKIMQMKTMTRKTTGGGQRGHVERWRRARQEVEALQREVILKPAGANKWAVQ